MSKVSIEETCSQWLTVLKLKIWLMDLVGFFFWSWTFYALSGLSVLKFSIMPPYDAGKSSINWSFWVTGVIMHIAHLKKSVPAPDNGNYSIWYSFLNRTIHVIGIHTFLTQPFSHSTPFQGDASISIWLIVFFHHPITVTSIFVFFICYFLEKML